MAAIDSAKRANLSRQGAFVRRAAKSLIRKRKKASEPGSPPSSHTGLLREFIYFAYEPFTQSVIIGPVKTNQVFFDGDGEPVTGTVPEVLEYGGSIRVREVFQYGKWRRADLRSRRKLAGLPSRLRKVTIAARPYMAPALVSAKEDLAKVWQNSVRRSA
ncbi:MAG: hypothetical protein EHM48_09340 [Planctomycetaceae bacterium]|nr:MAG: hypothetical protein EHM48_09340 [Planctomycetaceae bacterium]